MKPRMNFNVLLDTLIIYIHAYARSTFFASSLSRREADWGNVILCYTSYIPTSSHRVWKGARAALCKYAKKEEFLRTPLAVRTGLGPATPSVTG